MNKLQKAKMRYYEFKGIPGGGFECFADEITNYVNELEKERRNMLTCGNCDGAHPYSSRCNRPKLQKFCGDWQPDNLTQKEREI